MGILWGYHRVKLPPSITQLGAQSSGVTCVRARCWNLTEERHPALLHDARPAGAPDHWPPVVRAPLVVTISDHSTVRSTVLSLPAHEPMIVRRPRPAQFRGYPTKIHSLSQSQALWNKAGILGMSLTEMQCSQKDNDLIEDTPFKGFCRATWSLYFTSIFFGCLYRLRLHFYLKAIYSRCTCSIMI